MFCGCFAAFATGCLQRVQGLNFCAGFLWGYLHIPTDSSIQAQEDRKVNTGNTVLVLSGRRTSVRSHPKLYRVYYSNFFVPFCT